MFTQAVKKKLFYRFVMTVLSLLLLAASFELMAPSDALAEPSESIEITGDGVVAPVRLSLAQLQAMEQYQHVYSTINTWPNKRWYVGKGVKLRDLLALAGIKADAELINFTSNDGYTVTLTVKELLNEKRYYFPHLKDHHASDGSIPGSEAGAQEVEPILALASIEESNNPADMNDMNALLLMCGQRAVTEQTNNIFLKYISKIEVHTTAPPKWDNPRANMSSGEVSAGTLIELSNKSNDADKIYYTTDGSTPTIDSPIFNWSAKRWWSQRPESLKSINQAIEIKEDTIIKAVTIGPGRANSDVVTFTYRVGPANNADGRAKMPGGSPKGVTLDQNAVNLNVGGTFELEAIVGPDNSSDKGVTWRSSNTRVATVDSNGLVTVVGPGTAVITVKTVVGELTATCTVKGSNKVAGAQSTVPVDSSMKKSDAQESLSEQPFAEAIGQHVPNNESVTTDSTSTEGEQELSDKPKVPGKNWQYLVKKDSLANDLTDSSMSSSKPDSQARQVFEMSVDSVPLQLQEEQNSVFIIKTFILILFLLGAGRRYSEYKKEVAR